MSSPATAVHPANGATAPTNGQEQQFKALFMQAPAAIAVLKGPEHTYTFVNPVYQKLFGRTEEQLVGRTVRQVFPEVDGQGIYEVLRVAYESGEAYVANEFPATFDEAGELKTGYYNFVIQPIKDTVGAVTSLMVHAYEVTKQVLALKKAEESETYFRKLTDTVPAIIWITEPDGSCIYLNKGWYDYTGQTLAEAEGFGWLNATHFEDKDGAGRIFIEANAAQKPFSLLYRLRTKNGDFRWCKDSGSPTFSSDGVFKGFIGTVVDVHEERLAEERMRESEEFTRTALENSPDCVKVLDTEGRLTYMNYNGTCIMEVDDFNTLKNKSWWDLWPEGSKEDVRGAVAKALKGETAQFQAFCPTAKGTPKWWDVMVSPVASANGFISQLISVSRDITEKRKAEEAIRQSEKQFKDITEAIPQLVWVCNNEGEVVYFNDKWYEFTGTGPNESLGHGWSRLVHPDDVPGTLKNWNEAQKNAAVVSVEYRLKTADGAYRWVFSRGIPITNNEGRIEKWFGTCTDVHEQKTLAENLERLVAERTRELQRSNEDLQQFAHVASHDLKEPVRKIRTFGSRLSHEFGNALPEKAKGYVARMESAAARIYSMIDGVLQYSALNALEGAAQKVDLNGVLKSIETDLELPIAQKGVVIQYGLLPTVTGIPVLLYQLFYNLINNSIKFSRPEIKPQINIASSTDNAEKGYVEIVVRDNGIGFHPSKAGEIFKVFSRLHSREEFEGTGLGLSLCKKIVERHGGTMRAESTEGEGSVFVLTLPFSKEE